MGIFPSCSDVSSFIWLHHLDLNEAVEEIARLELHKDDLTKQHLIKHSCMVTCPPSNKTSKYDKQDMLTTVEETEMNSQVISCKFSCMDCYVSSLVSRQYSQYFGAPACLRHVCEEVCK